MTVVSGDLVDVTSAASAVSQVLVSTETRPHGDGLVVEQPVPATFSGGVVRFEAVPGPIMLTLVAAGVNVRLEGIVPDAPTATLAECLRDAEMAGGRDVDELAAILAGVRAASVSAADAVALLDGAEDVIAGARDGATTAITTARDGATTAITTARTQAVSAVESVSEGTLVAARDATAAASQAADDRRQTGEDRAQTGSDRQTSEAASAVSVTGVELVGQHLSGAESAADRAESAVESTRWEGDRLVVMGQTSPPLRGPALTWADLTQEQIDALRGPQGREGKPGSIENLDDHLDDMVPSLIGTAIGPRLDSKADADDMQALGERLDNATNGKRLTDDDLDELTAPGPYYQPSASAATPERGYPFKLESTVQVLPRSTDGEAITQVVIPDSRYDRGIALRTRQTVANGWSPWDVFEPTAVAAAKVTGTRLTGQHLDTISTPGYYYKQETSSASPQLGYPIQQASTLLVLPRSGDNSTVTQVIYPDTVNVDGFAVRTKTGAASWSTWDIYDSRATNDARYSAQEHNHDDRYATTTDVNTQISTLGGIYATKAELSEVVAGDTATTNDVTVAGLLRDRATTTSKTLAAQSGEVYADVDYTGATDVSSQINALISEAGSRGAAVKLGVGTLRLDNPIRPVSGTHLVGSGIGKTILKPYGESHAIYGPGPMDDVKFADFEIDGINQTMPAAGYTPIKGKGAFIEYMRRLTVENLYIHDTAATGLGIDFITGTIRNVWAVRCGRLNNGRGAGGSGIGIGVGRLDADWEPLSIIGCHTEGNGRFGIFLETQDTGILPGGITITACTSIGNKDGIGECGTTGAIISHNHVRNNTRSGIAVDTGTMDQTVPGHYALLSENDISGNDVGIILQARGVDESIVGTRIVGNHIWGNADDGIQGLSTAYSEGTMPVVKDLRVEGNDIHGNGGAGLHFNRSGSSHPAWSRVLIAGNRFWSNGAAAINGRDCGVRITVNTDRLVLEGNHTWDEGTTQPRSIVLSGTHNNRHVDERFLHAPAVLPD